MIKAVVMTDAGEVGGEVAKTRRRPGRPRSEEAAVAVLDAAYRLGASLGLKGATLQAIVDETGVAKMTIYKWWGGRLQLLIDAYMREASAALPIPEDKPPVEAISMHAARYVKALQGDLGRFQLAVLAECLAETGSSTLFVERYLSLRRTRGVAVIQRGKDDGSITAVRSAEDLYDQIYGTIFYRFQFGLPGLTKKFAQQLVLSILCP
jgi:AcrR family transcriptional regulator